MKAIDPQNIVSRSFSLAVGIACLSLTFLLFLSPRAQDLPPPAPTPAPISAPTQTPTPSPTPTPTPSPTPIPAEQNSHQWGSVTLFNGLPSDSVRAIAQTPDGVMWFGTDNGLARFDGRGIQKFSFDSAGANRITAVKTDTEGRLWVGTGAGFFLRSENGFQLVGNTDGVSVTAILLGREMFFGTEAGFVWNVTPNEGGAFMAEKMFPDPIRAADGNALSITSLVESEGDLLAGTSGRGVFVVKDGAFSEFPTAPRPIFVNSLARSENGNLWLGADAAKGLSGIYAVESGARVLRVTAPTAKVTALEANDSGLWAGTERYGLFHIDESRLTKTYTFANTSGGLRSDTIFTLFTDREGVIWIGTNRGVSRFDRLGPFQETVSNIANSNFIRTFFSSEDGRATYAGSNRGLFRFDGEHWKQVPGFGNRSVYAISQNADGVIIGTPNGIFDPNGRLISSGDTRSLEVFRGETYAAIFGRGVVNITGGRQDVVFPDETANALRLGDGKLWIGTAGSGLFSYDGRSVKTEVLPEALKSGAIWSIFESSDHSVWIAGEHGVFRMRDGQPEKIIEAEDVRDVYVGGEHVWAATTTRGLLHARHDEQFGWLVSSVGFEQGLPSEKAFSILPVSDGLLIATNRGVVTYRPGTVAPKLIATRILSQRIHDLGELRSTIALDHPQNSLLIEVAGQSSRTFPEEFQYSFLLKNAKGDIVDSRLSNESQYAPTNLASGEYTIESVAFNRDLMASEPLVIRFSVARAPFPWTATALAILLGIAIVALIWAIIQRSRIAEQNRQLAAARFDLANEAERERRRIARDLHDQTLADLRGLMMKSDKLSLGDPEFRNEIESVSTEIRRICEDLSPSVLENVGLVAALEFLLSHTIQDHKFTAADDLEERINFPLNVQLQIYRIAQEVLTNIKSHSDAKFVEMKIDVSPDREFALTIEDNGTPFSPSDGTAKGRGITNIRSRAALINSNVEWSNAEKRNAFELRKDHD